MNEAIVRALTSTVFGIFSRLFGEEPEVGPATPVWLDAFRCNMAGVVGLAGARSGLLAVHADRDGVTGLASRLVPSPTEADLRDTISEFANMIAGNLGMHARGLLPVLASSLPSVIEGENFYVRFVGGIDRVIVPFRLGDICFLVELVLDRPGAQRGDSSRLAVPGGGHV